MRYQPFYCEENVFHLCADDRVAQRPREIVFISNAARSCAMWHQRAAHRPGAPMVWDYHVVLLVGAPWEIWDLDTTLGFPVPALAYLRRSFRADVPAEYLPVFRVVEAGAFAAAFASDRSHMRGPEGWLRPPPPWPAPGAPGAAPNLMRFVDVTAPFLGEVMDLGAMVARVGADDVARSRTS